MIGDFRKLLQRFERAVFDYGELNGQEFPSWSRMRKVDAEVEQLRRQLIEMVQDIESPN